MDETVDGIRDFQLCEGAFTEPPGPDEVEHKMGLDAGSSFDGLPQGRKYMAPAALAHLRVLEDAGLLFTARCVEGEYPVSRAIPSPLGVPEDAQLPFGVDNEAVGFFTHSKDDVDVLVPLVERDPQLVLRF